MGDIKLLLQVPVLKGGMYCDIMSPDVISLSQVPQHRIALLAAAAHPAIRQLNDHFLPVFIVTHNWKRRTKMQSKCLLVPSCTDAK